MGSISPTPTMQRARMREASSAQSTWRSVCDDLVVAVGVQLEVARELGVGRLGGDLRAALDVAQVRHVGQAEPDEARGERGRGQREAPALAEAADGDARGIHLRVLRRRLQRTHGVGVEAPEVVRLGRRDAARHHAGMLGAGGAGAGIAGRAGQPLAALTARVHDEHGVPGGGEERVIDRERAAAAVADVVDEARRAGRPRSRGRRNQPRIGWPPKPLNVTSSTARAP